MFRILYQTIIGAILAADTTTALSLLQDNHDLLLDPLEGPLMHAEMLYYAIKKANIQVIRYLLSLCVGSDVPFYNFCGHTPLSLIMEQNLTELKDIVPEVIAKTDKNFALCMAVQLHDSKITDLLLKTCVFKDKLLKYLGLK